MGIKKIVDRVGEKMKEQSILRFFSRLKKTKHEGKSETVPRTVSVGQRSYNDLAVRKIAGIEGIEGRLIKPNGLMVRREYC